MTSNTLANNSNDVKVHHISLIPKYRLAAKGVWWPDCEWIIKITPIFENYLEMTILKIFWAYTWVSIYLFVA
jgi:hypothetical protein